MSENKVSSFPVNLGSSIPERKFTFKLLPFFAGDAIDYTNREYFPSGKFPNGGTTKEFYYKHIDNPYLDNEVKGYVQHLVLDTHMAPSTLQPIICAFNREIVPMLTKLDPDYVSISDYDMETLVLQMRRWLLEHGHKTVWSGPKTVGGDMEIINHIQQPTSVYRIISIYKYVCDVKYPCKIPEFNKDVWDIRKLGIPFDTPVTRPRYTVCFERITQPWFRSAAKTYVYYRLQRRKMAAILDDIKGFNNFSAYLAEEQSEITSFEQLDRKIMKGFFSWLIRKDYCNTVYNRRISVMRCFFDYAPLLGIEGIPAKDLILPSDTVKIVHHLPKFFTDSELKQMNEHIQDLPDQYGRALFILENCGMRTSDLFSSTIRIEGEPCLQKQEDGTYLFTYYMPKVRRTNTIPVNEIVGRVVLSAIEESRRLYGDDCEYILAAAKDKPMRPEYFVRVMNQMSKKYDLRKDDGSPLRIKGHTFRGTVATQYANAGISLDLIRHMLGQRSVGVLKHYVTIHGDTMNQYLEGITEENEKLIANIGHEDEHAFKEHDASEIPLPIGRCGRKSSMKDCGKANACYRCRMFHATKECLPIYKAQLRQAESNIEMAKVEGYQDILKDNEDLAQRLRAIIKAFEA